MATTPRPSEAGLVDTINITPLIDVMLVLLIMFIITIPPPTHAVKIDLPMGSAPLVIRPVNQIGVLPDGVRLWNGTPVTDGQLAAQLAAARQRQPAPEIRFDPDGRAPYLVVDQTLALIKRSGVEGFGFVGNEAYADTF